MNSTLKKQLLRTFSQMIADLSGPEEIEIFLKDFFYEKELEKYIKRISIAYWLRKGRTLANIQENLKASPGEISSVQKILKTQGIKLALKKIEAEEFANVWAERIGKFAKR